MISTLQISAVLDSGEVFFRRIYKGIKVFFRRIYKGIKTNEKCSYMYVMAVMVTVWQGFLVVAEAFTMVTDRRPTTILNTDTCETKPLFFHRQHKRDTRSYRIWLQKPAPQN